MTGNPGYTPVTVCRSCDSADLQLVLDLGAQPLANAYPDKLTDDELSYPSL